ncbi:hypothetical protein R2F61_09380 [Mollicutes bacterium LVI A0078]|nr:hypothetical protein R2F61_09380 [Mollicutes bacterium LVI A0078]
MVIRDVLYGDINIDDEVIEMLIRTKEMQRLRGIKQLGLTYMIFPGAEHSRYTHSIGVYYLATQIVEVLEKKSGMKFDEQEKKGLLQHVYYMTWVMGLILMPQNISLLMTTSR